RRSHLRLWLVARFIDLAIARASHLPRNLLSDKLRPAELRRILLHALVTFRAHPVGRMDVETIGKVILEFHPSAVVSNFSTPGTHPQQAFQVMQMVHQPLGQTEDNR